MESFPLGKKSVLAISAVLLLSAAYLPLAHAAVYGPYSLQWDTAVWNDRYVGNTVEFDLAVVNTDSTTPNDTISSVELVTPWQTYADTAMPVSLCFACSYLYDVNVTIPATLQPSSVTWTLDFTGTYSDGSALCSSTSNICSTAFSLDISPDPYALEQTMTSLNANITSLSSQISSLQSQLSAAKSNATALQSQLSSYQSQLATAQNSLTAVQDQFTTAKNNITLLQQDAVVKSTQIQSLQQNLTSTAGNLLTTRTSLSSATSALNAANSALNSTKATLATTQSSLKAYSTEYLPAGIAVPVILAAIMLVLYLRKGSK